MTAWADGLNYYLATHPQVRPRVITPLRAVDGAELQRGQHRRRHRARPISANSQRSTAATGCARRPSPRLGVRASPGSNGFAIAPRTRPDGHALLLINPHTSFFFRSELQVTSERRAQRLRRGHLGPVLHLPGVQRAAGWMHTSSGVDNVDEFAETVVRCGRRRLSYRYGKELARVTEIVTIAYRHADGRLARRELHHLPHPSRPDRARGERQLDRVRADAQARSRRCSSRLLRTKASDYAGVLRRWRCQANSSNNTIFADAKGTIAYLHPQFMPVRDDRFDYRNPVDGSDPATDWRGLAPLDRLPARRQSANGWLYERQQLALDGGRRGQPERCRLPTLHGQAGENPRGDSCDQRAWRRKDFTLDGLLARPSISYLPAFARLIPLAGAPRRGARRRSAQGAQADQIALLRGWDHRWSLDSNATSLAVFLGGGTAGGVWRRRVSGGPARRRGLMAADDCGRSSSTRSLAPRIG